MSFAFSPSLVVENWSFEPAVLFGIAITAALYFAGVRYCRRRGMARYLQPWRWVLFAAGLLTILIALVSPVDYWADSLFWVHMLQHELLTMFAAPLLLLGAPAMPLWRGVPLPARRSVLRWTMRQGWPLRVWRRVHLVVARPWFAWALFLVVFDLWHLPFFYDLALRYTTVHVLEHALMLGTALLFWGQVIPSLPFKATLTYLQGAMFLFTAAIFGNLLSAVYMYWTVPIYAHYIALTRTAGMMSALGDQQWAGGVMDVAGSMTLLISIVTLLSLWLGEDERAACDEEERADLARLRPGAWASPSRT